jgi:hypothetical protein
MLAAASNLTPDGQPAPKQLDGLPHRCIACYWHVAHKWTTASYRQRLVATGELRHAGPLLASTRLASEVRRQAVEHPLHVVHGAPR